MKPTWIDFFFHPLRCIEIRLTRPTPNIIGVVQEDTPAQSACKIAVGKNFSITQIVGENVHTGELLYICDCGYCYTATQEVMKERWIWQKLCTHLPPSPKGV